MRLRALRLALGLLVLGALSADAAERLIPFERNELWGYRDERGEIVIEPRFVVAGAFSPEGIAAVADRTAWAYIDRAGRVLVRPLVVDNGPDPFREGLARFVVDGRFGFFDRRGKIAITPRFAFAESFHEGRAAFCVGCRIERRGEHRVPTGGRWGFVDRSGETVVPATYEEVRDFRNGRARVRRAGAWIVIGPDGRTIAEPGSGSAD